MSNSSSDKGNNAQAVVGNIYCIGSALFFSACAYAQLNDPSPALWVATYLCGGVVPNLILTSSPPQTVPTRFMREFLSAFAAVTACLVWYKMVSVAPILLHELGRDATPKTSVVGRAAWTFLEHEEGRDSCGLILLIFHTLYLKAYHLKDPAAAAAASARSSSNSRRGSSNSMMQQLSPFVFSILLILLLIGAVYMWLVHHPRMVSRLKVPHCQGGMFGRDGEL
jgi:hypothetical protein